MERINDEFVRIGRKENVRPTARLTYLFVILSEAKNPAATSSPASASVISLDASLRSERQA
jgi:hypothetical protein